MVKEKIDKSCSSDTYQAILHFAQHRSRQTDKSSGQKLKKYHSTWKIAITVRNHPTYICTFQKK